MAYTETYKAHFTNEQNQDVLATIYKKDGPPVSPVPEYMCSSLELSDKSEGQTKYESTIIARELSMAIWTEDADEITWETFITAEHDEWKIIVTIDGQLYFEGFIAPDEGNALFQDKPYEVMIKATNGLTLLKDIDLVDINGNKFNGDHTLIEYICGALKQTGLELNIKIMCGYFNRQMFDKRASFNYDMFNQAAFNYRTFQSSATTFVSCYDALMIILDKFCRLEYWFGYWFICNIAELQYVPNEVHSVQYTPEGVVHGGTLEPGLHFQIGKAVDLYPINEDQVIYSRFAVKSAKTIFNYDIWPEIPLNNKFERGTVFDSGVAIDDEDLDSDHDTTEAIGTYKKFTIDGWEQGIIDYFDLPHPAMVTTSKKFWRQSIYNVFGLEIDRRIVSDTDNNDGDHAFWLRSTGVPVYQGDKISIGISKKFANDFSSSSSSVFTVGAVVYIVSDGVTFKLDNLLSGLATNKAVWREAVNLGGSLRIVYAANQKTTDFCTISVTSEPMPVSGTLYIAFDSDGPSSNTGDFQYLKDFNFEYIPYVAGGYVQVKGDYWIRSQNKNYPDAAKDEVRISDSQKKLYKGALLVGPDLAETSWYRYGLYEQRSFKELLNIARFNHSYRRMYAIDGTFNGLNAAPENDQLNKVPISFHKRYRMVDMTVPRDFVLVPPLKMDLIKGWVNMSLVEVLNPANIFTITPDADFVAQRLVDLINFVTQAEWNSAGVAPAPGTTGFPPKAYIYPYTPRSFTIILDAAHTVSTLAFANGAGNSPSITNTYDQVIGANRWVIYQIGTDVVIDNFFRVTIYSHPVTYTVVQETQQTDGTQLGDSSSFNYIFNANG